MRRGRTRENFGGSMIHLRFNLSVLSVVALTALSGVVSGALSNRWGPSTGAVLSGARLADIPDEFGDWQLQSTLTVEPDVIEMLQCSGSLQRVYRNRETGQIVSIALFLGPPGPISAHTPEVCYSTQDYERVGVPQRGQIRLSKNSEADFWRMKFRSSTLRGDLLGVAYAWNCGHGWVAPDSPRFAFAGRPMLYKIQLSSRIDPGTPGDPCEDFLKAFLPACDAAVFPEEEAS